MARLTEKENYLRCLAGEVPEWIPHIVLADNSDSGRMRPSAGASPSILNGQFDPKGDHKDIWGVEYVTSKEAAGGMLPKTWDFLLDDVTKWRDVIKAPDFSGVDWEMMAKKDLEFAKINRNETALEYGCHSGFFLDLMAFMGFTEGLCALFDEPEECKELLQYLSDFYYDIAVKTIDYYKPDILQMGDDNAAWGNPFVSLDMYREFFLPHYKRMASLAKERNIPITFHDCGKCEIFMDDMVNEIGVNGWNPAQNCNDLAAIKAKFGSKLVLTGCINSSQTFMGDLTEDQIHDIVWDVANNYAPGGGFAFLVTFIIPDPNDQEAIWKRDMVNKYIAECAESFYKK